MDKINITSAQTGDLLNEAFQALKILETVRFDEVQ